MMFKKFYWLIITIILFMVAAVIIIQALTKKTEYAEFTAKRPIKGNLEASIAIVEWSDFECSACGAAYQLIEEVFSQYQEQIKFEYRHFPLSYHRYAYQAAEASECAQDQGKFWEYYDKLFANQQNLTSSDLLKYAQESGLDVELFDDCLKSDVKKKAVDSDLAEASRLGLTFTPSIFVNGELIEDWANLPNIIRSLLKPAVQTDAKNEFSIILESET
ncbi:DsbA family protein [Patescibacteria group bacterium]|nr:DsbA family protein [Patescibacteria group bacterium]